MDTFAHKVYITALEARDVLHALRAHPLVMLVNGKVHDDEPSWESHLDNVRNNLRALEVLVTPPREGQTRVNVIRNVNEWSSIPQDLENCLTALKTLAEELTDLSFYQDKYENRDRRGRIPFDAEGYNMRLKLIKDFNYHCYAIIGAFKLSKGDRQQEDGGQPQGSHHFQNADASGMAINGQHDDQTGLYRNTPDQIGAPLWDTNQSQSLPTTSWFGHVLTQDPSANQPRSYQSQTNPLPAERPPPSTEMISEDWLRWRGPVPDVLPPLTGVQQNVAAGRTPSPGASPRAYRVARSNSGNSARPWTLAQPGLSRLPSVRNLPFSQRHPPIQRPRASSVQGAFGGLARRYSAFSPALWATTETGHAQQQSPSPSPRSRAAASSSSSFRTIRTPPGLSGARYPLPPASVEALVPVSFPERYPSVRRQAGNGLLDMVNRTNHAPTRVLAKSEGDEHEEGDNGNDENNEDSEMS